MDSLELKLCDIQGRLFELSGREGLNSEFFIKAFMMSKVAENLDSVYNRMQWAGEEYLLEELMAACAMKKDGSIYPQDVLFWIGYIYRYWNIQEKESSKKIYRQASAKTMNRNYLMFHSMDPEMAVHDLKEINRQRKHSG